jgi:enoyl-CoA hydratase/carnithine racemase
MTANAPDGFLADAEPYSKIRWELADTGIATLTLDRPEKLNAFDKDMLGEIRDAIWKASFDDAVRVVVITGAGRGFCSGRDIAGLRMENALPSPQYRTYVRANHETFDDLEAFEKPLIAAVNGVCAGGGVELAAACDIRVAAHEASFLLPETALGVLPASGACSRLIDVMGIGRLKEMVLTGDPVDAQEAYRIGLANHVVPGAELLDKANQIALRMISRAPQAVGMAKHIINACRGLDAETGRLFERLGQSILINTADAQRGMLAFEAKERITFEGR